MKQILIISVALFLLVSCSKDENSSSKNIFHKTLNITYDIGELNRTSDDSFYEYYYYKNHSIPITDEIGSKIRVVLSRYLQKADSSKVYLMGLMFESNSNQQIARKDGGGWVIFGLGEEINGTDFIFDAYHYYVYLGNGIPKSTEVVFPGSGDHYLGIRIKLGSGNTHYGWIKFNYASNGKSVLIKEYAYNKNETQPIKAGAK